MQNIAVKIQGLTKAFGANNVLRGIDLELPKGQVDGADGRKWGWQIYAR